MKSRRIAFLLSIASMLVLSLVGASHATAATTGPTATIKVTAASAVAPQLSCPVVSPYGHHGAAVCGTETVTITWTLNGKLIGWDEVVIGTDYRVYHDSGVGWSVLQGGAALSTVDPSKIGVFIITGDTVGVLGTTGHGFCNTTISLGVWDGWSTGSCFTISV